MKIAKIMNNNVVSALDEGNREIIVLGFCHYAENKG